MKKSLALISMSLLFFFSCKKYPEGPALSLASKKARLAGTWMLVKAIEDGVDKTGDYQTTFQNYQLMMDKEGNYTVYWKTFGWVDYSESGTWAFNGDKTYIIFDPVSNGSDNYSWKILRLKQKELWAVDEDYGGAKLEVHLIPK